MDSVIMLETQIKNDPSFKKDTDLGMDVSQLKISTSLTTLSQKTFGDTVEGDQLQS
jgi:hypothetical protein